MDLFLQFNKIFILSYSNVINTSYKLTDLQNLLVKTLQAIWMNHLLYINTMCRMVGKTSQYWKKVINICLC